MAKIIGTDGDDNYPYGVELRGTNFADQIYGLAGNDLLVGFDGDDMLMAAPGPTSCGAATASTMRATSVAGSGVYVYLTLGGASGEAQGDHYHLIEG